MSGTNEQKTAFAQVFATHIWLMLSDHGLRGASPFESGNVDGGWIVEVERQDGLTLNVEVVPGPWNDEG
jgi:hypothetical protein